MSVCTGSWALAQAGVLDGRRATTNKATFNEVVVRYTKSPLSDSASDRILQAATSNNIEWVPKARWVVDGTLWTASGVTAGTSLTDEDL